MMQLFFVFAAVSIIVNQLSAFITQLMVGKSWYDVVQCLYSLSSAAPLPGREVDLEEVNFILVDHVD